MLGWASRTFVIVGQGPGATALHEEPEEAVVQEAGGGVRSAVGIGGRKLFYSHLVAQTATRASKVKPREEGVADHINDVARLDCDGSQGRGVRGPVLAEVRRRRRRVLLSARLHVIIILVVGVIAVRFSLNVCSSLSSISSISSLSYIVYTVYLAYCI